MHAEPAEEFVVAEAVDAEVSAGGLETGAAAELSQQILNRHLDYERGLMIVEKSTWTKPVIARDYIICYHTEKMKRYNQEEGNTFGPDDEMTVPGDLKAKGDERREAYIRRFGHLFESK